MKERIDKLDFIKIENFCSVKITIKTMLFFMVIQNKREFPGVPADGTWRFHCCGWSSIPGRGTKIPQAARCGHKKKKKKKKIGTDIYTLLYIK